VTGPHDTLAPRVRVPDTLEEVLSPVWLEQALGQRFPGVKVAAVALGPVVSRVSTNARFHVDFDGATPPGLSSDLCVKGYFTDWSETAALSRTAGEPEAWFYRELAEVSGVRTLRCVYADVDPVTHHGVVITEDVAAAGATFLDALSDYTPDQTAASLEQYAVLHGHTWQSDGLDRSWLTPRVDATLRVRGLKEIRGNFEGPIGSRVPEEVRNPERLVDAIGRLAGVVARARPRCLLHGDAHVGNLYLDASGQPCLVDWQLVQAGPWYMDVGYHIACTVSVEDRRRTERDLLVHYLERLDAEGGDVPAWDDAWRSIGMGILYGFFLWGITLKVAPPITTVMLERLGTAVADHDAYSSVRTS
jgi:Phosphotransferase enzyme family